MSFDWATFLTCAESLARAQDEAAKRSAISRAYYAAYHVVRVFFRLTPPQGSDSHKFVWDAVMSDSRREIQALGRKGDRLKVRRKTADYEGTFSDLNYYTNDAIETARRIIAAVEALKRPPAE